MRVEQAFIAGLGFDFAGALLLARGAFTNRTSLVRLDQLLSIGAGAMVDAARDGVAAAFGSGALVLGFIAQSAVYFLELDGDTHSSHGSHTASAFVGLLLFAAAVAATLLLWAAVQRRLTVWRVRRVAAEHPSATTRAEELRLLVRYARVLGYDLVDDATDEQKAECVRVMFNEAADPADFRTVGA